MPGDVSTHEAASLLDADVETWLGHAAALSARGDPRGELVRVQLALETAQGPEVRNLLVLQEKILSNNQLAGSSLGPSPEPSWSDPQIGWRRGYIDVAVLRDGRGYGHGEHAEEPDMSALRGSLAEGSLGCCRRLDAPRALRGLPASLAMLALDQAVISPRLLALPRLRDLHVGTVVSSAPLRHPGLAHLSMGCRAGSPRALATAELPALETLTLSLPIFGRHAPLFDPEQVAKLGASVILDAPRATQGRQWSSEEISALAQATPDIVGLALAAAERCVLPDLPSLRRLRYSCCDLRTDGPLTLPPFSMVEELYLQISGLASPPGSFAPLKDFPSLANLTALHIEAAAVGLAKILLGRLERVETLSIVPTKLGAGFDMIKALLFDDALPALRSVAIEHPSMLSFDSRNQLEGLSSAPCASRLETVIVKMRYAEDVERWQRARGAFPRLKKLIVRGAAKAFPATARADLYELGHDVEWDLTWSPSRHFFRPDRVGVAHAGY